MPLKESLNDEVFISHLDTFYYKADAAALGESVSSRRQHFSSIVLHCYTQSLGGKCLPPAMWIEMLICQEKLKKKKKDAQFHLL